MLMDELGIDSNKSIVGFVYLGQEEGDKKSAPKVELKAFVTWV